jgi:hypothetical protein
MTLKKKAPEPEPESPPCEPLPLPVSYQSWYEGIENVPEMRRIVDNPVFRKGLAVLLDMAQPTQVGVTAPNINADASLGWYAGYADCIKDILRKLTDPNVASRLEQAAARARDKHETYDGSMEEYAYVKPRYDMSKLPEIPVLPDQTPDSES